jgi:hypothetical protein
LGEATRGPARKIHEPFGNRQGLTTESRRQIIARIMEIAEENDDIIKYAA